MTEIKRYYQKRYGEEFYILDSNLISEKEFDEKLEIQGYKAFEDSLTGEEVVELLNRNEELKDDVCDELDKALKVLKIVYDDLPLGLSQKEVYHAYYRLESLRDELR